MSNALLSLKEVAIADENLPDVDSYINTPKMKIPAPQVIILTNYNDVHVKAMKFSPRALYKRDNYTCQYCNKKKKSDELSIDHVIPRSKNGATSWENCVTACFKCNNKKSDRTLKETGYTLNVKPGSQTRILELFPRLHYRTGGR